MVGVEVDFAARLVAIHRKLHLPDDVLAALDIGQEPLREGDEFIRRAVHQPAVDPGVVVEGRPVQNRIEPVLTAHVAAQGVVDVAPRGKVADFGFEIECHGSTLRREVLVDHHLEVSNARLLIVAEVLHARRAGAEAVLL